MFGITIFSAFVVFAGKTFLKTKRLNGNQPLGDPITNTFNDEENAVKRFSKALKFQTVSYEDKIKIDYEAFDKFLSFLRDSYPLVYKNLSVEFVNDYALIFKWEGTDRTQLPIGLISHYDVVPILEESKDDWAYDPFGGIVEDGVIWGRGTLDDKIGVISILEAAEHLLRKEYQPTRDTYLMFGFDEEIGGRNGAAAIVEILKKREIQFDFVLDEGGAIIDPILPGIEKSTAVVGISEKGNATAELSIKGSGGHASQPEKFTNIGRIAKAIALLEETQFPEKLEGPSELFLEAIAPEMNFFMKYMIANIKLFRPLIEKAMIQKPSTAAMLRTTIAPTIFQAGEKANVLPEAASATINLRLAPGDSLAYVKQFIEDTIQDDEITVDVHGGEASRVSRTDGWQFHSIQQIIKNIYPNTIIAPYIMIAASDARHYDTISNHTFRFLPVPMTAENLKQIHGTNEQVKVEHYLNSIQFYIELIKCL